MRRRALRILIALLASAMADAATPATAQAGEQEIITAAATARDNFWRALDVGEYLTAFDLMTPDNQAQTKADAFAGDHARLSRALGPTLERRVMRTTVYENPANAPARGVYVAFDFVGRFEQADRHCGYIIMFQPEGGGPFKVSRIEQNYMTNASAAAMPSSDQVWVQMASAMCPGWQPSWTIEPPT